jgi:enoyl-[acyl-carrier protein] reductase I
MLVQMRAGAMTSRKPDWISKEGVAVGKGATAQEFVATVVDVKLEIDVAPWGEGHLKINGREVGHVTSAKDRRQAFRDLKQMAEHYLQLRPPRAKGLRHDPGGKSEAARRQKGSAPRPSARSAPSSR